MEEELKQLISEMEERINNHNARSHSFEGEIVNSFYNGKYSEAKFIIEKLKLIQTPSTQAGR